MHFTKSEFIYKWTCQRHFITKSKPNWCNRSWIMHGTLNTEHQRMQFHCIFNNHRAANVFVCLRHIDNRHHSNLWCFNCTIFFSRFQRNIGKYVSVGNGFLMEIAKKTNRNQEKQKKRVKKAAQKCWLMTN